jgi:hypothetical protein
MWTIIEGNVAIICACLPMCRVALRLLFPSIFTGTEESRPNKNTFSQSGKVKNDWTPSQDDTSRNNSGHGSVSGGGQSASEDYALRDLEHGKGEVDRGRHRDGGGITITKEYSVMYDETTSFM